MRRVLAVAALATIVYAPSAVAALAATPAPGLVADVETLVIDDVAPGHPGIGFVRLSNVGDQVLRVSSVARSSGALVEGGNLLVEVSACDLSWVEEACPGVQEQVVAPIAGGAEVITTPIEVSPGADAHVRITVALPENAGNEAQALAATVAFTWAATLAVEPKPEPTIETTTPGPAVDGPRLPATGPGTVSLTFAGGLALAVVGAVLLLARRRTTTD